MGKRWKSLWHDAAPHRKRSAVNHLISFSVYDIPPCIKSLFLLLRKMIVKVTKIGLALTFMRYLHDARLGTQDEWFLLSEIEIEIEDTAAGLKYHFDEVSASSIFIPRTGRCQWRKISLYSQKSNAVKMHSVIFMQMRKTKHFRAESMLNLIPMVQVLRLYRRVASRNNTLISEKHFSSFAAFGFSMLVVFCEVRTFWRNKKSGGRINVVSYFVTNT